MRCYPDTLECLEEHPSNRQSSHHSCMKLKNHLNYASSDKLLNSKEFVHPPLKNLMISECVVHCNKPCSDLFKLMTINTLIPMVFFTNNLEQAFEDNAFELFNRTTSKAKLSSLHFKNDIKSACFCAHEKKLLMISCKKIDSYNLDIFFKQKMYSKLFDSDPCMIKAEKNWFAQKVKRKQNKNLLMKVIQITEILTCELNNVHSTGQVNADASIQMNDRGLLSAAAHYVFWRPPNKCETYWLPASMKHFRCSKTPQELQAEKEKIETVCKRILNIALCSPPGLSGVLLLPNTAKKWALLHALSSITDDIGMLLPAQETHYLVENQTILSLEEMGKTFLRHFNSRKERKKVRCQPVMGNVLQKIEAENTILQLSFNQQVFMNYMKENVKMNLTSAEWKENIVDCLICKFKQKKFCWRLCLCPYAKTVDMFGTISVFREKSNRESIFVATKGILILKYFFTPEILHHFVITEVHKHLAPYLFSYLRCISSNMIIVEITMLKFKQRCKEKYITIASENSQKINTPSRNQKSVIYSQDKISIYFYFNSALFEQNKGVLIFFEFVDSSNAKIQRLCILFDPPYKMCTLPNLCYKKQDIFCVVFHVISNQCLLLLPKNLITKERKQEHYVHQNTTSLLRQLTCLHFISISNDNFSCKYEELIMKINQKADCVFYTTTSSVIDTKCHKFKKTCTVNKIFYESKSFDDCEMSQTMKMLGINFLSKSKLQKVSTESKETDYLEQHVEKKEHQPLMVFIKWISLKYNMQWKCRIRLTHGEDHDHKMKIKDQLHYPAALIIHLNYYSLQTKGAITIAESLQCISRLTTLGNSSTNISVEEVDDITAAMFCNNALQILNLNGHNNLQTDRANKFATCLPYVSTITSLRKVANSLAAVISHNTNLKQNALL